VTDIEEAAARVRFVGEGEFPAELDRVSWVAAFFPFLWAVYYGMWTWAAGFAVIALTPLVLLGVLERPALRVMMPAVYFAVSAASAVLAAVLALSTNRIIWRRAQRDMGSNRRAIGPVTVERYARSTQFWAPLGLALLLFGLMSDASDLIQAGTFDGLALAKALVAPLVFIAVAAYDSLRRRGAQS